ncbi:MAG TPA: hypothetical protein VN803_07280 [Gemmatimonadales bacterium]|nr:hypothetical protein [Gemmatimonadales bacterium]
MNPIVRLLLVCACAGPLAAQEPDRDRVERFKTIPAELLGRAYLVNENTLRMIEMARQGATVKLMGNDSATVTTASVDSAAAEYLMRRATYAAAIRARGFAQISGEYEIERSRCPAASRSGPVLATLSQQEFVVTVDETPAGVVVEKTLVIGQGDESDDSYRHGRVGDRKSELRPFEGKGCATVLARYQRPTVALERPEQLIGTWEGKWDDEFGVRFTITPTDSGYTVLYEWQEYQGRDYQSMTMPFHPSSKSAIRGGAIVITAQGGEYGARAVGNFVQTRSARLKKVAS